MEVASPHLARLGGQPRPAGSAAAAAARAYCAGVLRDAGFGISEQTFEYSAFPASWAIPIGGAVAWFAAFTLFLGRRTPALLIAALAGVAVAVVALSVIGRRGVLDFPMMRRRGVNLVAVRAHGEGEPTVWLVAHVDTKWQPVSMLARVVGIAGTALGLIALALLVLARDRTSDTLAVAVLVLTWIASSPLLLSIIGDRSHGTLDNASGVAAVLEAGAALGSNVRAGVLITDAEELVLAGARSWARSRVAGVALNCDGVDDGGALTVMYSGVRPDRLVSRFAAAASSHGEPMRVLRLIPGVLTDSVALTDADWQTVTLSRGTLRTLLRIHTSRDTLAAMRGTGIEGAARVLATVATELG